MKKIIPVLICMSLMVSISACNNPNPSKTDDLTESPTATVSETAEPVDTFPYPTEAASVIHGLEMSDYQSKDAASKTMKELAKGNDKTIVAYGTSLTQYAGWVDAFKKIMNFKYPGKAKVINSAQGASDSNWGRDNLKSRVLDKNPDMVFIEFSINDAFLERNITVQKSKDNLNYMIDEILKKNPDCEIVIMTMNMPLGEHYTTRPKVKDYYQAYRDVAKDRKLMLIDNLVSWEDLLAQGEKEYKKLVPDGIHPSANGHIKINIPNIMNALYNKK